jgi:hypothetical protein
VGEKMKHDIISQSNWAFERAPDPISAGQAARVQQLAALRDACATPAEAITELYGDDKESAEAIARNCMRSLPACACSPPSKQN